MAESVTAKPRQATAILAREAFVTALASREDAAPPAARQQFLIETPSSVILARRRPPATTGNNHINSHHTPTPVALGDELKERAEALGAEGRMRSVVVQYKAIPVPTESHRSSTARLGSPGPETHPARQTPTHAPRPSALHSSAASVTSTAAPLGGLCATGRSGSGGQRDVAETPAERSPARPHTTATTTTTTTTAVGAVANIITVPFSSTAAATSATTSTTTTTAASTSRRRFAPAPADPSGSALSTLRLTDLERPSNSSLTVRSKTENKRRARTPRKVVNLFLCKYILLRTIAEEHGFSTQELEEDLEKYQFNLIWSDTVLPLTRLVRLSNWQRTNHFPSMHLLCRKGHLGITLGRMRRVLPTHFNYYPRTWSLRSERHQFTRFITAVRSKKIIKFFIMKPNSGCQGKGIVITRDPLAAVEELDNYIVQEYITRPLLLEGRKFDLRVYVLLTSIRAPSIFLFNDGLVRMCAETYEKPTDHNARNTCKHLTNYAVNKHSPDYVYNSDATQGNVGNKRDFKFLNAWFTESGMSPGVFWEEVAHVICKTILVAQPQIANVYNSCFARQNDGYNCFEVLGFDILIDSKMRPWLMEVNHTPSLSTDTPLDYQIKHALISEVWDILDIRATDRRRGEEMERDRFVQRMMRPGYSSATTSSLNNYAHHYSSSSYYSNNGNASTSAAVPPRSGSCMPDNALTSSSPSTSSLLPTPALGQEGQEWNQLVAERRAREDTKLCNFARIYPTSNTEHRVVYDAILAQSRAQCATPSSNWTISPTPSTPHGLEERLRRYDNSNSNSNILSCANPSGNGSLAAQRIPSSMTAVSARGGTTSEGGADASPQTLLRNRAEKLQQLREDMARRNPNPRSAATKQRPRVSPVICNTVPRQPQQSQQQEQKSSPRASEPQQVQLSRVIVKERQRSVTEPHNAQATDATHNPIAKSTSNPSPSMAHNKEEEKDVTGRMDALRSLQERLDHDAECELSASRNTEEDSFALDEEE